MLLILLYYTTNQPTSSTIFYASRAQYSNTPSILVQDMTNNLGKLIYRGFIAVHCLKRTAYGIFVKHKKIKISPLLL